MVLHIFKFISGVPHLLFSCNGVNLQGHLYVFNCILQPFHPLLHLNRSKSVKIAFNQAVIWYMSSRLTKSLDMF